MAYNLIENTFPVGAPSDVQLVLDGYAAMTLEVLGYRGLRQSYSVPPEQIAPSLLDGPWVWHTLSGGTGNPATVSQYLSTLTVVEYHVASYLFVAPLQQAKAPAWAATLGWIAPLLWAYRANIGLGGLVQEMRPLHYEVQGSMAYGGHAWTGLIFHSAFWLNYQVPAFT